MDSARREFEHFSSAQFLAAIKKFPRSSAAGGSVISATHLLEMISIPCTDDEIWILGANKRLVNHFASGKAPPQISPWLSGATFIALNKRDGGVHPIAVGEVFRRLISSLLMSRVSDRFKEILQPIQHVVAVQCGFEGIIHSVRKMVKTFGKDSN